MSPYSPECSSNSSDYGTFPHQNTKNVMPPLLDQSNSTVKQDWNVPNSWTASEASKTSMQANCEGMLY